jgi:uncharacterized protein YndB with AHSA1/START domain
MAIEFTISETINAPLERVFSVATDLDAAGKWMQNLVGIEKLTEGPMAVGSQWRETRKMFGRKASEHFEVTALVPNENLDLYVDGSKGTTGKGEFRFRHTFEASGGGTVFTLSGEVSGMGKFMELIGRLFIGGMKKAIAKDITAMKHYIEKGS